MYSCFRFPTIMEVKVCQRISDIIRIAKRYEMIEKENETKRCNDDPSASRNFTYNRACSQLYRALNELDFEILSYIWAYVMLGVGLQQKILPRRSSRAIMPCGCFPFVKDESDLVFIPRSAAQKFVFVSQIFTTPDLASVLCAGLKLAADTGLISETMADQLRSRDVI